MQPDPRHFVAITDPGTSMAQLAEREGFRRTFLSDPEIGGRYSALSPFGIVPATLAGVDTEAVLEGARVAMENCELPEGNTGLWLGAALGEMARHGRDKLTFVVDPPISSFGLWAEQLVAESTGKQGRGILPIADEPLMDAGRYGPDRVFVHLRDADGADGGHEEAVRAFAKAGHPTITLTSRGVNDLGRIFFFAEFATAVAGWALEINPFDQPNVQEAKDNTTRVLERGRAAPTCRTARSPRCADGLAPPSYLAVMGYLPYDDAIEEAVDALRAAVIERRGGSATTWGYGPRFLHSTGQFHKGGPPTGQLPPARARRDGRPRGARAALHVPHAHRRAGRRRPADAARARPDGRPGTTPDRRSRRCHQATPGASVAMQIGFVGLGKMGGNMVARILRDSDHEVVAFDYNEAAVATAAGRGATGGVVAAGLRQPALQAPRTVWVMVPSGDPTEQTIRALADVLESGDTIVDGGNTKWHDDVRRAEELSLRRARVRRRRHVGRRVGPRDRLLHDGRRRRDRRAAARARSSTCSLRRTAGGTSARPAPGTS